MCGFVNCIHKNKSQGNLSLLKAMASTLDHRGPDEEGFYMDEGVCLAHKRLSIIDIKGGQQPMTLDERTIVYNGEVYNYVELREDLKRLGYSFRSSSDTEVILKAYEHYGNKCVEHLNGMFAFTIHDKRRNKIFIARDHFGIKPLYYSYDGNNLIMASEIKAILKHPEVTASVSDGALQEYLSFQFVMGKNTMFKGIKKVLPGHTMELDLNTFKLSEECYWEPDFTIDTDHSVDYFKRELRYLLEDTIKTQLRSDVPLGSYLSGGLDSSVVSIMASQYYPGQMQTFTGAFSESKDFDETEYAKIVANSIKANYHEIYPTEKDFTDILPKLIYHLDEPVAGPGIFPQYMVSKLAREHVTVVLGGQGGDEIFGGYARYMIAYFEQALKGAMFESAEEGEHIVTMESIIPNLPYIKKYAPMMRDFWSKGALGDMDRRYFDLIDRSGASLEYFSNDFQVEFDKENIFSNFQNIFNHPNTKSYYNKMTHFDMFGSLPGLLQVEDRVSMSVSLESRVPLLDRRIVDLVASMPPAMKFKGAGMKYFFKQVTKDIVPDQIINRKDKMGFPVPLHLWSKNGASGFIKDILLSQKAKERGIYDPKAIETLMTSERPYGRSMWGLLSLELWFREFIDK